jgi:hypothetical protein
MRTAFNPNLQVTREDYARCVGEQVAFLASQDGREVDASQVSVAQITDHYYHGVSVDAAADDLFYLGVI